MCSLILVWVQSIESFFHDRDKLLRGKLSAEHFEAKWQSARVAGQEVFADASVILAYQLIAAKLNLANGSNPCSFAATIAEADALIGGRTIPITPKITPNTDEGQQMVSLAHTLEQSNTPTPGCTP